jgi:hypothetical protein
MRDAVGIKRVVRVVRVCARPYVVAVCTQVKPKLRAGFKLPKVNLATHRQVAAAPLPRRVGPNAVAVLRFTRVKVGVVPARQSSCSRRLLR